MKNLWYLCQKLSNRTQLWFSLTCSLSHCPDLHDNTHMECPDWAHARPFTNHGHKESIVICPEDVKTFHTSGQILPHVRKALTNQQVTFPQKFTYEWLTLNLMLWNQISLDVSCMGATFMHVLSHDLAYVGTQQSWSVLSLLNSTKWIWP